MVFRSFSPSSLTTLHQDEFLDRCPSDPCFYVGAICMELVRQCVGSQFLSRAVKSLTKVHELSLIPLPFASVLVAQAEGSLGSKERWNRNLRLEWYNWPSGMISTLSVCAC